VADTAVADGAAGATDGVADGAVGPAESADGTAANDCDEAIDDGGRVAEGAPVCTPDVEATDPRNDAGDVPRDPDDSAPLEQPASIPSTARLTPAHRRPRISLL
jgi:hypothetical protein